MVSYYDAVETRRTPGLLEDLKAGQDILLITDAGTPAISDPGYRLVAAAAAAGLRVTALPGPSAVTTALAVSGLPTDRFCFEGFPPRGKGQRASRFAELAAEARTQVYFEAGRRLAVTLAELAASHGGDRRAVVCRELTKTHEEIVRGTLAELAEWAAAAGGGSGAVRGEITLVVAGTDRRSRPARAAGDTPGDADRPGLGGPRDARGGRGHRRSPGGLGLTARPPRRRPASRRTKRPPAVPGLKAMTAARQPNGTAGSTYR